MDAELRRKGRNPETDRDRARLLRERLRAGLVAESQVGCAAYLGDPVARLIHQGWESARANWITELSGYLVLPPPEGLVGPCSGADCGEFGDHHGPCGGLAEIPLSPGPVRYYSVLIAEAVGRACLPWWEQKRGLRAQTFKRRKRGRLVRLVPHRQGPHRQGLMSRILGDADEEDYGPRDALDAARAWLREPTRERQLDTVGLINPPRHRPDWAYQPLRMVYAWDGAARHGLRVGLISAQRVLPTGQTRAVALEAIRPHLGLG